MVKEYNLNSYRGFSRIEIERISLPVRPFGIRLLFIGDSSGPGNSHMLNVVYTSRSKAIFCPIFHVFLGRWSEFQLTFLVLCIH